MSTPLSGTVRARDIESIVAPQVTAKGLSPKWHRYGEIAGFIALICLFIALCCLGSFSCIALGRTLRLSSILEDGALSALHQIQEGSTVHQS
ncbi:hypothetical protein DL96DRAFT_1714655 [Flagelloscypha sp. PMI_526]|nr:hypothetical protein DL96DRAFT_1714655 [Flagelloscypha sp. PMI_526]